MGYYGSMSRRGGCLNEGDFQAPIGLNTQNGIDSIMKIHFLGD
jgi:hypothetical protein